jgi:hypothetical protein
MAGRLSRTGISHSMMYRRLNPRHVHDTVVRIVMAFFLALGVGFLVYLYYWLFG